jgi:23S rRNA (adenine2503-C2)-methyltransferase
MSKVRDDLRDYLVPINKTYNIKQLLEACREYSKAHYNRKVLFEYVMLKDVNDSLEYAHELFDLLKDTPSLVNLIPVRNILFNIFAG